jgi:hypothetical protein
MNNKTPAYIYSVSNLATETKTHLEILLPDIKISHVNLLNLISHACKYKNYQSLKNDNQSFEIKNFIGDEEDFRTKHMFSAKSLAESVPEIKKFIQTIRIDLLNDYQILEMQNKYFTTFLPDYAEIPENKIHKHSDVIIEDLDQFIFLLKKQIDQKFSIDFNLDNLKLIVGNQLILNIESETPINYYKELFNELYTDIKNNDWFSPKRIYTSYDDDSKYHEDGEKIGLIELTFKMLAYQKAVKLGFDFTDKDSVCFGDDTMLTNK